MKHANDNGKPITFISMFSGIEAASVAFGPLGWKALCFAEIEKFPSAVLAHRYPDVPNVGDMSKHDWAQYRGKVDIVCGGPPCQDFSIAGLRAGLDGERGNLSIVYMRALHAIKPRNAIVENVPGWLNDKKNAFGCFLAGLVGADDPLRTPDGKSWPNAGMVAGPLGRAAWRVLDAQYFGLAQRRRRVIVVADFGNGADPAAVLFERKGLFGNTPPSREAGKGTAGADEGGAGGRSLIGGIDYENNAHGPDEPTGPLLKGSPSGGGRPLPAIAYTPEIARCDATREGSSQDYETTTMVAHAIQAGALRTNPNSGPDGVGVQEGVAYTLEARAEVRAVCVTGDIAHTLKAEGADASEDGTGGGTPIVAQSVAIRGRDGGATAELGGDIATALRASQGGGDKPHVLCFSAKDYGADASFDIAPTLRAGGHTNSHANAGVMPAVAYNSEGCEYAHANEADANSVLSTLRDAVGEEAFTEWGLRVLGAFQSQEILRSWLHGQSIRGQAQNFRSFVDDCALPCAKTDAGGVLREVWVNGPDGRSSQGRGLAKQLAGKPGEALSVLPPEGASPETDMQHLREAREGARLLRQALSAVQEVRRPAHGEGEPEYATSAVRRLTARECERLQGFQWLCSPDYPGAWQDDAGRWWSPDYTDIPWRGKPNSPDGPRYKSLGNSWAVPKFVWLGQRIQKMMPVAKDTEIRKSA